MASIVLGPGASHSPLLALEGQRWGERGPTTAGTCG